MAANFLLFILPEGHIIIGRVKFGIENAPGTFFDACILCPQVSGRDFYGYDLPDTHHDIPGYDPTPAGGNNAPNLFFFWIACSESRFLSCWCLKKMVIITQSATFGFCATPEKASRQESDVNGRRIFMIVDFSIDINCGGTVLNKKLANKLPCIRVILKRKK